LTSNPVFAHKDRIEKPKTYKLTFQDGQTVSFDNTDNSSLISYGNDIANGKRKLVKAELSFRTGEILTFEGDGSKWTRIQIADSKNQIDVPNVTTEKIPIIHIQSIALLWDGRDEKAFKASYFYVSVDIGTEKPFNRHHELHLFFFDKKFSKSEVWRQTSENSKQRAEF
jgi:hypothetical protein